MIAKRKNKSRTTDKTGSSRSDPMLEISLPDGVSPIITPLTILIAALMISISIIFTGSKFTGTSDTLGIQKGADTSADEYMNTGEAITADSPGDILRTFETFTEYDTEICTEDGKPVVYLFSTTWCPHCTWIKDTFDTWAKDNSDKVVAYHWELDTNDNTLTSEVETSVPREHNDVYNTFNPNGSIPTFVFGCRFGRVGNGFEAQEGLDLEREAFDAVLSELLK